MSLRQKRLREFPWICKNGIKMNINKCVKAAFNKHWDSSSLLILSQMLYGSTTICMQPLPGLDDYLYLTIVIWNVKE
jgi:hypothetical protein